MSRTWSEKRWRRPRIQEALQSFLAAVDEATLVTNSSLEVSLTALEKGVGLVGDQAKIILSHSLASGLTSSQLADPAFRLALTPNGGMSRIVQEMVNMMATLGTFKTTPTVSSMITADVVSGVK